MALKMVARMTDMKVVKAAIAPRVESPLSVRGRLKKKDTMAVMTENTIFRRP